MKPIEHIDQYMAGELSVADKAAFEAAMGQDADLRELVNNYHQIKELSTFALEEHLLEKVKLAAQSPPPQENSKSYLTKFIAIAAAVLVLVIAAFYLFRSSGLTTIQKEELIAAYYEKPYLEGTLRSNDTTNTTNFDKAKYLFGLNRHGESLGFLEKELVNPSDESKISDIKFLSAHVYFIEGKYKKALEMFSESGYPTDSCFISISNVLNGKSDKSELDIHCRKK